jgi:hypothetical protein
MGSEKEFRTVSLSPDTTDHLGREGITFAATLNQRRESSDVLEQDNIQLLSCSKKLVPN